MQHPMYSLLKHFKLVERAISYIFPPDKRGHERSLHISDAGTWNVFLQTLRVRGVPLTLGELDLPPFCLLF